MGNSSANFAAFSTTATYESWHTATTEWTPGMVSFYLDGTVVGSITKSFLSAPAHWVLQTETSAGGGAPASSVNGYGAINYIRTWSYMG